MSRPRFNPTSVGLPEGWRLTKFTELKGCGCKVPQNELLSFLDMFSGVNTTTASSSTTTSTATTTTPSSSSPFHLLKPAITDSDEIGIGLDSCVVQTRFPGIYLVQTTDL